VWWRKVVYQKKKITRYGNIVNMNTITDISQKLSLLANDKGIFQILAFDHRGSFKKMMQKTVPQGVDVTDEDAIKLKEKIISSLAPLVTGILIDQDYGIPAYKNLGINTPFILPTEKTGYTEAEGERINELMYSGESLIAQNAMAMKLLIYANTNVESWIKQLQTSSTAIMDAHDHDLPIFLEFVLYDIDSAKSSDINKTLSDAMMKGMNPDVWKIPYPGSTEMCQETTKITAGTPWVLLTGGSSFEEFISQYQIAKENGAEGFVAGRALWQEACDIWQDEEKLKEFLDVTLPERFKRLISI
jgi:tagatose 1,6-diphosphate aldolase